MGGYPLLHPPFGDGALLGRVGVGVVLEPLVGEVEHAQRRRCRSPPLLGTDFDFGRGGVVVHQALPRGSKGVLDSWPSKNKKK